MRPLLPKLPLSSRTLALIALIVIDIVIDLGAFPLASLPIFFALPTLIAALVLPPRDVRIVAVVAFLGECIDVLLTTNSIVVIIGNGGTIATIGLLAVILAQKREEANALARAADASRQSLQQFTGMVAHDLRSPLAVLYGYAQGLQRPPSSDGLSEKNKEVVERIILAAERMRRLTNDLVDASRIGAGHFEIELASVDLIALIRTVIEEQQSTTTAHSLTLEAPNELIGLWDRGRVAQVLTNLVANSIKYSAGGEVRVTVREAGREVICCVADQGTGLTSKQLATLFQPFVRYDHTQTGVGLGLFISRGIVEAHQGRLWAESEPGSGSTFCLSLPLRIP